MRDVARQLLRNREDFAATPDDMPVFGTVASRFNDDGVTALYQHLRALLAAHGLAVGDGHACRPVATRSRPVWPRSCRPRVPVPGRDRRGGARLPRPRPASRSRRSVGAAQAARPPASC